MILGVSGHRKLSNYKYVYDEAYGIISELKPDKIITGMAIGYDLICADIAVSLNIPYVAALPFAEQSKVFPYKIKGTYNFFLSRATEKIIVSDGGYEVWKYQSRNMYIVDNCDQMLFCFDGKPKSGTFNCLQYAKQKNKPMTIIDPVLKQVIKE
jgi:uncharacterized phage-like protein YoqJ